MYGWYVLVCVGLVILSMVVCWCDGVCRNVLAYGVIYCYVMVCVDV